MIANIEIKPATIAILEDDPSVLRACRRLLSSENYNVQLFDNPVTGLKQAQELLPDLIMLGIMMPDMNGLEVLQELKVSSVTENIPVIMLTNLDDFDIIQKAWTWVRWAI